MLALETFRRIENRRTLQQLKARSELMVTRFEADENERKGLERAYGMVQAHESRARHWSVWRTRMSSRG